MNATFRQLARHQADLRACRRCPGMQGPVVVGEALVSDVLLIGQAPGAKEGALGRPFAWTAGKTLFGWFAQIGLDEAAFRRSVYMAAVCRCFPGKKPRGGDRVPSADEIANCAAWLAAERRLLAPRLLIPVGKLAISQLTSVGALRDVVGKKFQVSHAGQVSDVIPLPHPSGASTWHRTQPGKTLLDQALQLIAAHPAWRGLPAVETSSDTA